MQEYFNEDNNQNTDILIKRFEEMLRKKEHYFFDIEDFEDIIDYYFERNNIKKIKQILKYAIKQHPSSTSLIIKKAQLLSLTNKPEKAIKTLSEIEILEPNNFDIYIT